MPFLFHDVIFGPVRSRRLGLSLGINLLPLHSKFCSFNCIYCECGWTPAPAREGMELPTRAIVASFLEEKLKELAKKNYLPDAITYAGNGEPTLHPEFSGIVDDTTRLRNQYSPHSKVCVLSNASRIHDPSVFEALLKLDNNILKLDAGTEKTFRVLNNPVESFDFARMISDLEKFKGNLIIQSMFLKGVYNGATVDNTTAREVGEWIGHLKVIRPKAVMIYPIARATPAHGLEKIGREELERIAVRARQEGLEVKVYD
ncbi:MAG: radical SAM protein [Bacteroidetes bacterium]|nr:radical SAM protein [Bacteroidota bacterium]